jgi:histidinol-phosphate aminotransferase
LDFNENTLGPSPAALRALRGLPPGELARYPELEPWRARFARRLGLPPQRLFLAPGTDEAIAALVACFGRTGTEVLYPVPTFGMYRFYADRAGLSRKEIPFGPDLAYPVPGILKTLQEGKRKPSLVFLASPNNPTGSVLARRDLLRILACAKGVIVAVDEAYIDFGGASALPLLGRFPNLVVLRTFSKAYGLAGLRVGFLAGNPRVVAVLERAASPYRVTTASLAAAEAALGDRKGLRRHVRMIRAERSRMLRELASRGIRTWPSAGNFLLFRPGSRSGRVLKNLARAGIRLRDRSSDPGLAGCLRVTIGSRSQMDRFLKALDQADKTEGPR